MGALAAPLEVTVVLATYNGAAFIEEQVESLCAQSLRPAMVVVTDDGSTDDTLARAASVLVARGVPYVITRNPGRRGFGENFFHGLSLVRTEFIAFCDQDDVWEPHKLQVCVHLLETAGADVCAHGARLIDRGGRDIGRFATISRRSRVYESNCLGPWLTFPGFTLVFRSSLLAQISVSQRGQDIWRAHERLAHDSWITRVGSSLGRIVFTSAPLARYRQHGSNLIGARQDSLRRQVTQALGPAADSAMNRSAIARAWARELRRAPVKDSDAARAALRRWKIIAAVEMFRLRMYAAPRLNVRATLFAKSIVSGLYAGARGAIGSQYLPKDFLIGVLRIRSSADQLRRDFRRPPAAGPPASDRGLP